MRPRRTALRDAAAGDGDWLAVMAALTVLELGWWALARRAGAAPAPLLGTYLLLASGGLAGALALRLAICPGIPRGSSPAIIGGTLLVAVGASAFLPLKYAIPSEIPFWLDRPLAVGERAILGSDPWLVLDQAIGWATRPMDWLYGSWLPVQLLVMFLVLLSPPSREKSRLLISYSLAWFVLGAVGAVLLSSAGPIFYDRAFGGVDFAALAQTLRNRGAWIAFP